MTGLNRENTTKDTVFYYFDNPKNGGDVSNVELNIKEGWALVYFEVPQGMQHLSSKQTITFRLIKIQISVGMKLCKILLISQITNRHFFKVYFFF